MPNLTSSSAHIDLISATEAVTLPGLLQRRLMRSPAATAYREYNPDLSAWQSYSWFELGNEIARWRQALAGEGLGRGARVGLLLPNSVAWVCFEQAALALGLVVVPLYTRDNPENQAYVLHDAGCRLLLVNRAEQWQAIVASGKPLPDLAQVLALQDEETGSSERMLRPVAGWLPPKAEMVESFEVSGDDLASIVYTSGTTGPPKGVMLSHRNILWNCEAILKRIPAYPDDVFLSFLPLSHTFERTVGYYIPMMAGSCVAYARSVQDLAEDLLTIRPTILISVPRIYERIYAKIQQKLAGKGAVARFLFRQAVAVGYHRFEAGQSRARFSLLERLAWPLLHCLVAAKVMARLGGRIRIAVTGGAPLENGVARFFIGLGLPLLQGYGLTETAPVISANRLEDNIPASVGEALSQVEIMLGDENELLVRSPGVMLGYWHRPQETQAAIDREGWLHTGDVAQVRGKHIFIRGRLKEILVSSAGEKVPPTDLELLLEQEPLFEQAMVVGEGMPYIAALLVLQPEAWRDFAEARNLDPDDSASLRDESVQAEILKRISAILHGFPAAAQVHAAFLTLTPWTIDNGLLTATMKLKRAEIAQRLAGEIRSLYQGHDVPGLS